MNPIFYPLLAAALMLVSTAPLTRAASLDEVGKAMTMMLGDAHVEARRFDQNLNQRILERYLETLDPHKIFLTQGDVDEFEKKYVEGDTRSNFDILLLRTSGMVPALEIYTRFAERVAERTEYIETLADNAAFDFTDNILVPLSRKKATWPKDSFAAQPLWRLKIADELLREQILRGDIPPEEEQPAPPLAEPAFIEPPFVGPKLPPQPVIPQLLVTTPGDLTEDDSRRVIKKRYLRYKETVQSASDEEIADYFFSAVAQAYDPHSDYLSDEDNDRFDRELRNQLSGIGAELASQADGSARIEGIIVNGPAHRQEKLQPNDRIIEIDPLNDGNIVDITFLPIEQVVDLLLGRKDTFVGLFIQNQTPDDNEKRKIVIQRGTIELRNAAASAEVVRIAQPTGPPRILAWITIPSFYLDFEDADPSIYKDLKKLVSRLKRENVDGIALDLRNNGGGSLTEVPRIAGLFLPRGPVVQAKNQLGKVEVLSSTPLKPEYDGPLIVVTDRNSASSSEILAGVLQDYNRAIIVGESSTFGKGTVQEKMAVANFLRFTQDPRNAGDLKTTVQKFYRVTGSSTQLRGITPDIILPSLNDSLEIGERFLSHALPHDSISPAPQFRAFPSEDLFLHIIADQSRQRVQASTDFRYIREDLIIDESRRRNNIVTLNREKRLAESKKKQQKLAQRNQERGRRFQQTARRDRQLLHSLRLTLEDTELPKLKTVDRERDSQAFILRAKDETKDPDAEPNWPSGFDPVKRESLNILSDFIAARIADAELEKLKKVIETETAR